MLCARVYKVYTEPARRRGRAQIGERKEVCANREVIKH